MKNPPAGLDARGRDLWRWLMEFEPETHELVLVLEACRIADRLDKLAAVLAKDGLMTTNAKDEPIVHPALVEARQQTATLNRTLASLRIPSPGGDNWDGLTASARARKAAMARHYPGGNRA